MRKPIFVRALTEDEQRQIQAGLRSADAFVLRRCQIVLAAARGERAPVLAHRVGSPQSRLFRPPPPANDVHRRRLPALTGSLASQSARLWQRSWHVELAV